MARRKRRKAKKNWGKGIMGFFQGTLRVVFRILPVFLVAGAGYFLFTGMSKALHSDSHLRVLKVAVEPADGLSAGRREFLDTKLLGKNILNVDLKAVAREVEKNPQIRQARMIREFPDTILVEVEKRQPVAFVRFSPKGGLGVVSADGMILDTVRELNSSLVLIEAYSMGWSQPRIGRQIKSRGFVRAIAFLDLFWAHPIAARETVTRMVVDHLGNVTMTLSGGPDIRLGRDPETRLEALSKIIHLLEGEGRAKIDYIDLQYENVVVKRR